MLKQFQVFTRDSHDYGFYLEDDVLKPINNNMNDSILNQSSAFLGMPNNIFYDAMDYHQKIKLHACVTVPFFLSGYLANVTCPESHVSPVCRQILR